MVLVKAKYKNLIRPQVPFYILCIIKIPHQFDEMGGETSNIECKIIAWYIRREIVHFLNCGTARVQRIELKKFFGVHCYSYRVGVSWYAP